MDIKELEIPYYYCFYDSVFVGEYEITLRINKIKPKENEYVKEEDIGLSDI